MAGLAAAYAVEQVGTIEHHYSWDEFKARYQESFGEPLPL
jgi:adenosine kinase